MVEKFNRVVPRVIFAVLMGVLTLGMPGVSSACTGISLKAENGDLLFGRTMEWGAFDLKGRVFVIPRGHKFVGHTPDNKPGFKWQGKYGVIGIDMLKKELLGSGINEKGLGICLLYHPGFAQYAQYDPAKAATSMGPLDVTQYLLATCASVDEIKGALKKIRVVPVNEPAIGIVPPIHLMIVEPSGKRIVVEFLHGKPKIFDAPLGVMTNAPTYDWHMINLRNYMNLSAVAWPAKKIQDMDFTPLGGGSGMIGLPGDFTPPSRFVRAVAYTATARKTKDGPETVYEMFRIMDNFNLPLGAAEGSDNEKKLAGMRSSTIWTVVYDTKNRAMYYHTQHNRRVRKVDMKKIDFSKLKKTAARPLDKVKAEDMEEVNPLAGK